MLLLLACQGILLLYSLAITCVGISSDNNNGQFSLSERLQECSVNELLLALPPAGFLFQVQWLMAASLILNPALLLSEYVACWQPYFQKKNCFQVNKGNRKEPIAVPENALLPTLPLRILHGLMLTNAVCTYIYFFSA